MGERQGNLLGYPARDGNDSNAAVVVQRRAAPKPLETLNHVERRSGVSRPVDEPDGIAESG